MQLPIERLGTSSHAINMPSISPDIIHIDCSLWWRAQCTLSQRPSQSPCHGAMLCVRPKEWLKCCQSPQADAAAAVVAVVGPLEAAEASEEALVADAVAARAASGGEAAAGSGPAAAGVDTSYTLRRRHRNGDFWAVSDGGSSAVPLHGTATQTWCMTHACSLPA